MAIDPLTSTLTLVAVAAGAIAVHVVFWRAVFRFGWRSEVARTLQRELRWPARLLTAAVAVLATLPVLDLSAEVIGRGVHLTLIVVILAAAWVALRAIRVGTESTLARLDLTTRDNLLARRRLTQTTLLRRLASVGVAVFAGAAILLTFPSARSVGASLLASAGLAGLIAGLAARSTLGNMIAGLQIAFAEPIRLDDVVVVEEEWGNVEEITLTYVVVRLWDKRRLILPTTYFVETPFENWTRSHAQVLGAVTFHLDHRAPVAGMRQELLRCLESNPRWDGDVWVLQVIDTTETTMIVRALVTAEDAPTVWDLRCDVREHLIAWLAEHHPEALPTRRVALTDAEGTVRDQDRVIDISSASP
ncbi:MAG: mechanosensitive ion channel family protein [Actinobacteria bacterium]|nr:mechanosensitive ion channel family protein [Actinomycetota bacterium]